MVIVIPNWSNVSCIYLFAGFSILPAKRNTTINKNLIKHNNRDGLSADL
jgi:hypothetical protein